MQAMPSQPLPTEPRRSPSLFFPTLLIGLGVLLLLGNLGVISFDFGWALLRLWPLLLIAAGADLLFGRNAGWVGPLLALLLLGIVLSFAFGFNWVWQGRAGASEPIVLNQPAAGLESARVQLVAGVTQLQLDAAETDSRLVEGRIVPLRNERIDQSFRQEGDIGVLTLRAQAVNGGYWQFWNPGDEGSWQVKLNRTLPTALTVETGVGVAELDLRQLNLTSLQVNAGVGQTKIYLPATGDFSGTIKGGVGQTSLFVPANTAVRIKAKAGLGGVSVDGNFEQHDDVYTSPTFADATQRIDLEVEGGIGQIAVREID